jgi:hypothetical protein
VLFGDSGVKVYPDFASPSHSCAEESWGSYDPMGINTNNAGKRLSSSPQVLFSWRNTNGGLIDLLFSIKKINKNKGKTMATKHLASWSHKLQYTDLPPNVVQLAVRSFYNWVGCAIGGSNHPATTIAVSLILSQPGRGMSELTMSQAQRLGTILRCVYCLSPRSP